MKKVINKPIDAQVENPYYPINSHKEGDMAVKKLNKTLKFKFFKGAADLKIYVSIYVRKQTRQKMEGFSAR